MVDEKTLNLQLPLPHPSNLLGEDVLRLAQALTMADAAIKVLQTAMAAANQTLGSHGHAEATAIAAGFMAAADKAKLDGIAAGANAYSHPASHPPGIIAQDANNRFMTDAERAKLSGIAAGATAYAHPASHPPGIIAQDANNRFMTDAERAKLGGIEASANAYSHPASHPASMIAQDANNRFVTDAEKATWNAAAATAGGGEAFSAF